MRITFIGNEFGSFNFESVFRSNPFFAGPSPFITQSVSGDATTASLEGIDSLNPLILEGSGFTTDAGGNLNGGTITSVSIGAPFASPFEEIVTFSDINWSVSDFLTASEAAYGFGDFSGFSTLFNAQGPVTFDASEAIAGVDPAHILDLISEDIQFIGSTFTDFVKGGIGDDTINGGGNDAFDSFIASLGNDVYDFTGPNPSESFSIDYSNFSGLVLSIDGVAGTGSAHVESSSFTDQYIAADVGLNASLNIFGSAGSDVFDLKLTTGQLFLVNSGVESNTVSVEFVDGGEFRYSFFGAGSVTVDLSLGTIIDNGFGNGGTIDVSGTGGVFEIRGSDQTDVFIGDERDNLFILGGGDDTVTAGDGWDVVRYDWPQAQSVHVDLSLEGANATVDWEGDIFNHTISEVEEIRGTRLGDDTIIGASADEVLLGRGGNDDLDGAAGNDFVNGEDGEDTIAGGRGDDTLHGEADDDLLEGGRGNDTLDGGDGIDTASYENASSGVTVKLANGRVFGGDNADLLIDIENLIGSDHDDKLVGDTGANLIEGGDGNDVVRNLGGNDTVNSGFGDDNVFGNVGDETIDLGDGNDSARTRGGNDFILLGDGDDTVTAGGGDDIADGSAGDDRFFMGSGNDSAFGGFGIDTLNGGFGADVLDGGPGDDLVRGDAGVDHLNGNSGNDLLNGGANADTFWFFDIQSMGQDRIKDFEDGLDKINLSDWGFGSAADVLVLASSAGGFNQHTRITFTDGVNNQKRDIVIENLDLADFDATDILLTGDNPFDIII